VKRLERIRKHLPEDSPHEEALDGLATSVMVEEPEHGDGASGGKE
jgi:hypothetical protein